ncbi:MAG: 30S ribosomal protein S5 [Planctomycetota bacterium]
MVRITEESNQLESNTIGVFRTAATVKGGRRFSFGSLVVVGDRNGRVALGYAKANEVPPAIEKAGKEARKKLHKVTLQGNTIPHEVIGRAGASTVKLMPASPGTGVVAGPTVRAVLELAGITDCMTKAYGSTNKKNLAKAVVDGLRNLRSRADIEGLRGQELGPSEVDERIARASAFQVAVPVAASKSESEASDSAEAKTEESGDAGAKTDG